MRGCATDAERGRSSEVVWSQVVVFRGGIVFVFVFPTTQFSYGEPGRLERSDTGVCREDGSAMERCVWISTYRSRSRWLSDAVLWRNEGGEIVRCGVRDDGRYRPYESAYWGAGWLVRNDVNTGHTELLCWGASPS